MFMNARVLIFGVFIVLILGIVYPVCAQESSEIDLLKELPVYSSAPHFGLQMGSMFTSGLGGGSMFTHSVAPSLNWDVSRRFNLHLGTILSSSQMNGMNALFPYTMHMAGGESVDMLQSQRLFNTAVYATGTYQVSPRLSLIGSAWVEHNNLPELGMNPQAFDTTPRGGMFGFDYRVSESFRFGAEVRVSTGYNPLNPFYNSGMYGTGFDQKNGFHSPSPFHRDSRW